MKLNNKIMLITYADSLGNDLNELKSVIDKYYAKAVGGIHILPFSRLQRIEDLLRCDMIR